MAQKQRNDIWLDPYYCVSSDTLIFGGPWTELDAVSSVDMAIYLDAEDKTSTLAAGSNTVTDGVATYKTLSGFEGGKTYVVDFMATASDGQVYTMKMELHVEHAWKKRAG